MIYSGVGLVEQRARLSALIADILPDPLTGLLFPSSGAEANEAAIRIARRYTGKAKILTQYRSYHGGTSTTLGATGDVRRGYAEATVSGFVHMVNPTPWLFSWGEDAEESAERSHGGRRQRTGRRARRPPQCRRRPVDERGCRCRPEED